MTQAELVAHAELVDDINDGIDYCVILLMAFGSLESDNGLPLSTVMEQALRHLRKAEAVLTSPGYSKH